MNIIKATRDFERWLAKQIPLVRSDVALKHQHMAESPFAFFRATFYRWLQQWHKRCDDIARAPKVLAVGDLHIENFGTWRSGYVVAAFVPLLQPEPDRRPRAL